jgi:phosphoglycolate phosphatase/pyrophosphatase PpaX
MDLLHLSAPLTTVLFDFDDTLADSFRARVDALSQAFSGAGISHLSPVDFFHNLNGGQLETALADVEAETGVGQGLMARYRDAYWTKESGMLTVYPGVRQLLQELASRGIKLGVVTQKGRDIEVGGRRAGVVAEMAELGILDLFLVIIGFEDVANYKPHPEGVNLAMNRLEASAGETVVVGDSVADIGAARAAGCWSCHATWGLPPQETGRIDLNADMVAKTPDVLLDLRYI